MMVYEKLFINKQHNLYIDEERTIKLQKHQRDGLRFLHGHYKKNAPGVILNDPTGSGRKVQIVLFLSSLHSLLAKPVLIISDDVHYVEQLFYVWTNQADDVICNSKKVIPEKRIFLNDFSDISPLCESDWSIMVVEDEQCSEKLMKQLKGFKADYKIVVISADLKKDVTTFFGIYQWIVPNNITFSAKDFVFNKNTSVKNKIEKAVLLDCFYETIVLRRTDTGGAFKKDEAFRNVDLVHPQKKNKDTSGTKIKRTRKNKEGENESTVANQDHEQTERKNKRNCKEHEKDKFIEEIILEQTCIENMPLTVPSIGSKRLRIIESDSAEEITGIKSSAAKMEIYDDDQKLADTSLLIECRDNNDASDHSKSFDKLNRTINIDIIPENNKTNTAIEICIKDNDKVMAIQKTVEVSENMFTACDTFSSQTNETGNYIEFLHDGSNFATGKEKKTVCISVFDVKLKELEEKAFKKYKGSILDDTFSSQTNEMRNLVTHDESKVATGISGLRNKMTNYIEVTDNESQLVTGISGQTNEKVTPDESNLATGKVKKETVTSCNKINTSVFDVKLKEIEEKAFKKYKGSILDSIF